MRRRLIAGAAAMLVLLGLTTQTAAADTLQCGAQISQDTTLDNDLIDCPGDGIVIGADGIELDLNGHVVDGVGTAGSTAGIRNSSHPDVRVENGTVEQFHSGIRADQVSGNVVRDVTVSDNQIGVDLELSTQSRVARSTVSGNGLGILLNGMGLPTDNIVRRNELSGNATAVETYSEVGDLIAANTISGHSFGVVVFYTGNSIVRGNRIAEPAPGTHTAGILVSISYGNQILNNHVDGGAHGVDIGMNSAGNLFRGNRVSHAGVGIAVGFEVVDTHLEQNRVLESTGDGIFVGPATGGTVIEDNRAKRNGQDGIDVDTTGVAIAGNTANRNGDLGIEAEPGAGDGGGNSAARNGNPAQCVNIVCG